LPVAGAALRVELAAERARRKTDLPLADPRM